MPVDIVGWAHAPFVRADERSVEQMIVDTTGEALAMSGLDARDIDAIYLGHFNGGFVKQEFSASLVLATDPALRFTPATRVENACATGTAAIHQGINLMQAGKARNVLVVGVEKMSEVTPQQVGDILLSASYVAEESDIKGGFAGVFAHIADLYFQRFGDQSDALASIAAKNHANGVHNPLAQMRRDFGYDFCRQVSDKNPIVAGPLKRTDCSLVSDGAAALVLSADDETDLFTNRVRFRATAQVNDFLPLSRRDIVQFEGPRLAWRQALERAGMTLDDLDFAEVHDCFTIAELLIYEAMGLAETGQGARVLKDGIPFKDGKLPINISGGLKSKGHPIGATGVSMHAMSAMQLTGMADAMQLDSPRTGAVFNMGGAAVANYVSILERVE